ncbi:MAG: peptidoglycan DD-metalloendopeptidase family protein [Prevotellaceae bacterium]|jgi:septal ring factor EnvC (AmiA/AmiB activator)|nr:peptidoglycan DD-metalloendopeptidase family protein [Prevotellaceae bacterium]
MSKNIVSKILCLIVLFCCCTYTANSQTIAELEAQKKRALEKVAQTQKLLDETKKSKTGTEKQISLLSRSIDEANQLIFAINSEIDGLNRDIQTINEEKNELESRLKTAKNHYAKMLSKSEIYRKQFSPTLYIFSSKSFAQAYRRLRYMQEVSNYQKNSISEITSLTKKLTEKTAELQSVITKKERLLNSKESENKKLAQQKEEQNKLLKTQTQKEKEYKKTIAQEQENQKKLNKLIQQKVAAENKRKAELAKKAEAEKKRQEQQKNTAKNTPKNEKAAEPASKPAISDAEYKSYQEDMVLTGNFEKNRGKLPMPVEQGKIHRLFGRQTNPYTKAVEDNNGIYIVAPAGSEARAVFDGTVFEVMFEPGSGYVVWIMHGSYSTVYAQLSLCSLKKGDKITARQKIGKIAVKNNNTELNFYVLNKNSAYENPTNWVRY